jgi:hypothetical protein
LFCESDERDVYRGEALYADFWLTPKGSVTQVALSTIILKYIDEGRTRKNTFFQDFLVVSVANITMVSYDKLILNISIIFLKVYQ